jgi:bacteriocin-like protein
MNRSPALSMASLAASIGHGRQVRDAMGMPRDTGTGLIELTENELALVSGGASHFGTRLVFTLALTPSIPIPPP